MSTNENKILAKLEKLIALSGSPDEHEANSAMEKAIELATLHNIELSRVSSNCSSDQVEKEEMATNTSRLPVTHRFVADILKNFFEVEIITGGNRATGRRIYFVGKKDKIEFARFLNEYLTNTFFKLWYKFYKNNPEVSVKTARESYFCGLWQGLTKKLKDAKQATESTIASDLQANYTLMAVNSSEILKQAITKFFPDVVYKKGKTVNNYDSDVASKGFSDGQKIVVHSGLTDSNKSYISI